MKTSTAILAAMLLPAAMLHALTIPSDGSDGNFNPTVDIEVDLSQAVTGSWDQDNSANIGMGVYDPEKWAVVFKYSSVNIPAGVTVTFKNHTTRAPVVWLVQGSVNIEGVVSLDGKNSRSGVDGLMLAEPGPGGFRGGAFGPAGFGAGLGIGGVIAQFNSGANATHASSYGNPAILPLIGGSGGGANTNNPSNTGSGGGGAIMIGTTSSIQLSGTIQANGGLTSRGDNMRGSGGAIKLIAETVSGNGSLSAHSANTGRIRIETASLSPSITMTPETVAVPPADPPILWPGTGAPTVRIVSVGGQASPTDPTAPMQAASDVGIASNTAVQVVIETTNFPPSGVVEVRRSPKFGNFAWTTLTHSGGDFVQSTWTANITFPGGFTALQARATVP